MPNRALGFGALCALGSLALAGGLVFIASPSRGADIPRARADTTVVPDAAARSIEAATEEAAEVTAQVIRTVSSSSSLASVRHETFIWPVTGAINTPFGGDHDGLDIEGETGDEIVAARSGRITFAGDDGDGYGTKILISHPGGMATLYSHLSSIAVEKGWVDRGMVVGRVGCTGSCSGDHLHFEIHRQGRAVNPLGLLPD